MLRKFYFCHKTDISKHSIDSNTVKININELIELAEEFSHMKLIMKRSSKFSTAPSNGSPMTNLLCSSEHDLNWEKRQLKALLLAWWHLVQQQSAFALTIRRTRPVGNGTNALMVLKTFISASNPNIRVLRSVYAPHMFACHTIIWWMGYFAAIMLMWARR